MTPIALFLYARPDHAERTISALLANRRTAETRLVVFCDGARSEAARPMVAETRRVAHALLDRQTAFAAVEFVERQENWGLTRSIVEGIGAILAHEERVIVVEDDIVTAPGFLPYMLEALDHYVDTPEVITISGFTYPSMPETIPDDYPYDVFFNPRNASWGWGVWADRWRKFDFAVADYPRFKDDLQAQLDFNRGGDDLTPMLFHQMEGSLNTWDVQVSYAHYALGGVTVCPFHSLVDNIGLDGSGEHCGTTSHLHNDLSLALDHHRLPDAVAVDERIMEPFRARFRRPRPTLIGGGARAYWAAERNEDDSRRLATAEKWVRAGALDTAWRLLEWHIELMPGDPDALALMGEVAALCDKRDAARALYVAALDSQCDHPGALQGLIGRPTLR